MSTPNEPSARQRQCTGEIDAPPLDITAGIGFEYSIGEDASSWFGGRVNFCTAIGITCLGAIFRGAADPTLSGKYRSLTNIRSSMDVMLALSLPIDIRRIRINPHVGLGAGWVQTSKRIIENEEPVFKEASFGGVRLELSISRSVNLFHSLYLDLAAGLTTSFIAEEEIREAPIDSRENRLW